MAAQKGLKFSVHDIGGGGDCDANSIWMLESDKPQAFIGDMVYNQNFTYMNDGQILHWISNLHRFEPLLKDTEKLYIGHGTEGGFDRLGMQKDYLFQVFGGRFVRM